MASPQPIRVSKWRPGHDHGPVVRGQDAVAAERGDVDTVVEALAVDDERAPRRRAEGERDPRVRR